MTKGNWQRNELILAFNLYCKTPFGRIHNRNPDIIALAHELGRSSSALSWKLANFARLDPALKERGIIGAEHGSKGELEVWNEFNDDWERLSFESEQLLAQLNGYSIEKIAEIDKLDQMPREGKERERLVRARVNQKFFRASILAAYNNCCCITGLPIPELLVASHIVPWSNDSKNRLNPRNGLCLNAIHDRAFDRGLITITSDYKVKLSSLLKSFFEDDSVNNFFVQYEGVAIKPPQRFVPDKFFLEYHHETIFRI